MLDNFREWLSDNLRYILLGAAGLLLIVIIFFAVRLVTAPKKTKTDNNVKVEGNTQNPSDDSVQKDDAGADSAGDAGNAANNTSGGDSQNQDGAAAADGADTGNTQNTDTGSGLVRNQQDILDFVTQYYNARAERDYDTLAGLCEVFDDTTKSEIERKDALIESYSNFMAYSKKGLEDGSYVVYVYFDAKLTGVTTLAPCLRELYLTSDASGSLIISDTDQQQQTYIEQSRTDQDVQALIADVDKKLEDAVASDETLKSYIESNSTNQQGSGDSGSADGGSSSGTAASGTAMANTGVNVRSEPSTNGALYGTLYAGMEVEVIENLDSGWTQIRYTTEGTTIEGYVMTQYLN